MNKAWEISPIIKRHESDKQQSEKRKMNLFQIILKCKYSHTNRATSKNNHREDDNE